MFGNSKDNRDIIEYEMSRKFTEEQNARLFKRIIYILIGVCVSLSPIAIAVGIVLNKFKKRKYAVISSLTLGAVSLTIINFYNVPTHEVFLKYLLGFLKVFRGGKGFFEAYFSSFPCLMFFFGLGIVLGAYIDYWLSTDSYKEKIERESRQRYNKDGEEEKFIEPKRIIADVKTLVARRKAMEGVEQGTFIGIQNIRDQVWLSDKEAGTHGLVLGTTGAGKTVALLNFVKGCAERGVPLIYVDGKRDEGLPEKIRKIAENNKRNFIHFDMRGKLSKITYNPLKNGDAMNIREKLIGLTIWSEEHYRVNAERAIMFIAGVLNILVEEGTTETEDVREGEESQKTIYKKDIFSVQDLLIKDNLEKAISEIKDEKLKIKLLNIYCKLNQEWYIGIDSRLALLSESPVLSGLLIDSEDGIDLKKSIENGDMVLFSLDGLQNRSATEMLGRLIVEDVNTVVSLVSAGMVSYAIFDEHGAYISDKIENQLAMARSFGLRVITSSQEISDYEKSELGDILVKKVLGCTNWKLILLQNDPRNAELIAETFGTTDEMNKSASGDYVGRFKGLSISDVEKFKIHPNKIKELKTGEAVLLVKRPELRVIDKIKINMVEA